MRFKVFFLLIAVVVSYLTYQAFDYIYIGRSPYVTIIGPVDLADGIGRQSVELAQILMEKFSVNILCRHPNRKNLPQNIAKIIQKKKRFLGDIIIFEDFIWKNPAPSAHLNFCTPRNKEQIRIAYSMFESTSIPHEGASYLNECFDLVVVPDPFLVEIYKNSGVQIPIFVIPLGLNLSNFFKTPLKKERNTPMVFANLSSCFNRKNQLQLLSAFYEAFGERKDVLLKINCRDGDKELMQTLINEIERLQMHNVLFSNRVLDKDEYLNFFQSIDCYVSLSKGEGFSIQPREAMALGIPAIVTDNTGQKTICDSKLVRTVESNRREPAYYPWTLMPLGEMFDCDLQDVVEALKDMHVNYNEYLQKSHARREWAKTYDYSQGSVRDLYYMLTNPKEIILSNKNEISMEGLRTDSEDLYMKYKKIQKENTSLSLVNFVNFLIKKHISKSSLDLIEE